MNDFECPRCGHCCQGYELGFVDGMQHQMKSSVDRAINRMTPSEELHLKAAGYANRRKEAYLDYVKKGKGSAEKLSEEMLGWVWVAHYEGDRDAVQEQDHG